MAKQLKVDLTVNANTEQAKAQIADLQKTLEKVAAIGGSSSSLFNTSSMQEASKAARELQSHLQKAVDVNTGKLNLSTFSASLKSSGKSLADYKTSLEKLGPEGEAAFLKVSKSIATADAPLMKTNAKLKEFATTLKNTARWQISSSILHGFMGSVQAAHRYALDLNKSLNDIRIVTGQNTEQMTEFAEKANKAAKALSTTTTAYTNAALIYYQQGDTDKEVLEKTDVTVKMANVTGQEAQVVSDQLTAIWNNFNKSGEESYERYADVLTALGAATASSTDEIAGGLEKFASICDMIGLSYDYAATALATITATTRQSEDVVGTALKTIFARIQGLSLGETLEDGTDLNKYSAALEKVGISIKDQNGELKDMDNILNEMGAKWQTLSKDQQVALAQTVAGVRQYNQLVSLMDNWDYFGENLAIAQGSEGELQKQADIYAESWEAAQKRVKAAAENIYSQLLNDDFFIDLNNGFAVLLEGISGFIDGLGGMKGILLTIAGFITQSLAKEAPAALTRIKETLMQISGLAHKEANDMQQKNIAWLQQESKSSMTSFNEGEGSLAYAAEVQMTEYIAEQKNKLIQYENQYSEAEKAAAEQEIAHLQQVSELLVQKGQRYDQLSQETLELEQSLSLMGADFAEEGANGVDHLLVKIRDLTKQSASLKNVQKNFKEINKAVEDPKMSVEELRQKLVGLAKDAKRSSSGEVKKQWGDFATQLDSVKGKAGLTKEELKRMAESSPAFQKLSSNIETTDNELNQVVATLSKVEGVNPTVLSAFVAKLKEMGIISSTVPTQLNNVKAGMENLKPHVATTSEAIINFSGALMQCNAFISSMKSLGDVFTDKDATAVEKVGAVVGALTATIMTFTAISKLATTLMALETKEHQKSAIAKTLEAIANGALGTAEMGVVGAKIADIAATLGLQGAMAPLLVVTLALVAAVLLLTAVAAGVTAIFKGLSDAYNKDAIAAKEAAESAKNLAEAAEEANNKLNEITSAVDEYKNLVDELDKCTEGTEEWNEALKKVNDSTTSLLKKYPELLKQKDLYNEDGTLNQDTLDRVVAQYETTAQAADAGALMAQAEASRLQARANVTETARSNGGSAGGIIGGAAMGAAIGTAIAPGVGSAVGAVVGGIAGQLIADEVEEAQIENLAKQYELYGESVLETDNLMREFGIDAENATEAQLEYIESIRAVVRETDAATQALDNAAKTIVKDWAETQNMDLDEAQTEMMGEKYEDIYDSIYDEVIKTDNDNNSKASKKDNSGVWERYLAATGKDLDLARNGIRGTDNNRTYAYLDEDGEEKEIRLEEIAETIAAAEALNQLGVAAQDVNTALNNLANNASSDEVASGLRGWVANGNFDDMTQADYEQMKSDVSDAGGTDAYLQKTFGMSAQELAATFGDNYVEQFEASMEKFTNDSANIGEDLLAPVKQVFDAIDTSNLTLAGQKAIASVLQEAFVNGGAEGMALITDAMHGMDAGEAEAFANTLSGLDWDSMDAATLAKTLKQAGVAADFTTEELNQMIDAMSDPRAVKDFDTLAEGYASLHEVADGLEFGDTISAEDFAVLGDEFESYFTRMADGTYKLTGDAEDFYDAVQEKSIEGFVQNIDKLKEQNERLKAIQNFDFEDLTQTQNYVGEDGKNYYSGGDVGKQIQTLEAMGYDAEQIAKWNEDLADGQTTVQTLQEIADATAQYRTELNGLNEQIFANEQAIFNQEVALATSYTSLQDLKKAYEEGTFSAEAFSVAAMQLHEAESMEGLDVEELDNYADHLMEIADDSELVSKELAENEEAAEDVAKATMKLNRGIDKLADGFEDWSDVIENSDESSQEFAEAMSGMKDAMSDILGTSKDFISNDFIVEHLEDIEKAATGDEEAIRNLQRALSDDILCTVMGVSDFSQLDADMQNLQGRVWELSNQDIQVGATLDQGEFINSANELIKNAGMTVDEAQAYFNSLGYEPEFVTEEQTVKRSIPQETTHTDYAITPGTLDIMGVEVPIPTVDRITTTRVTGYEELDEVIQVPALSADGTPQIKSLTRTNSGGSLSNYSSGNKGGKAPGSGGGKGGGGGGNKEVKDKKNLTDEKERYHEITNTIEDMQHALDRVSAAKDRAFGKAKIAKINEEIAAYDNLIAAQQQYVKEIEDNYKKDKNTLAGYGASFDKNGNVDNYDQLMASQVQRYNDAVAIYNASAQTDADKEAFQAAEDYYEAFLEALNQYEETHDLKKEAQATLEDQINARYDLELEKIDYKVNLQIDFSDDELEHLEYLLERIEAKGFSAAEAIANLGQQTQSVMNKSDAYKEGIFSILGNHGLSDSDINAWLQGDEGAANKVAGLNLTEAEVEKLREYTAGLRDNNEALIEMRQAVHDKMLETFDEWNEKIDRNIDKLDHLKSMTESYRNIVDLVGKANFAGGAETIERLNASTVKQAGNYAQANIANRDRIAEQLQATRDAYAAQKDTISEEERKMWEDTIKEMEDQLNEAEEAAMGSIEEWMEAINQQFLDSVTNTMDKFADAVAGRFANLNELSEAFERQQSVNDRYLESYEKIYEFSKLNRDIEKSIDQTDNIKAKKELADLQAEINALEESGAEVSEYQMENLRKRYELKLAELALEEAQNAKSEVRMTRDNEGNWGYVYTADETQVAEAEQNYEDKLYELQQHNAEYINQLQESIITMQQEMYDKMQEIAQDESLSIEERQAKMQEVQAYYQEQMGYYYSELELVLGNNKVLYEDDWQKYSDMTGYKIAKDEEYVDSFDETAYSVLTGFTTMEDAQAAFNSASETMLDENLTAMETWQTNMETGPLAAMDSSFDTLAQDIDGHLTTIEQESDNTAKEIEDDTKAAVEDYNGVVEAVKAWETQYSASVKIMIDESDNLIAKFNQVLALWADVKAAAEEAEDPPTPDNGGDDGGGGDNGGGGGGGGDGKPSWDRVVAAYNKINGGKWGNGLQNRINKGKSDGFTEAEVRAGQQLINYTYPPNLNGYGYSREKAKSLMGYDTGGYTGEWGDTSGRLALLHQKELVLNQEDTANMLSAIEMIRQISSLIDLNAMSSMKGLGGMLAAGGVGQTMGGIEQHIEIHASFPDATDHSEIEEAFHNLLNSASQYANRKL